MMPGESARESTLTAHQEMNRVMVKIVNGLKPETEVLAFKTSEIDFHFL